MRDCEDYQVLISRLLDEDLNKEERDALAEHVKRCPDCAAVYVAFRSLSEHLREEPEPLPAGLHENIMANIRRSGLRSVSPERRSQKRWRALLATAACFVVIAAAGLSLPKLMGRKGSAADLVRAEEPAVAYGFKSAPAAAPAAAPEPEFDRAEAESAVQEAMEEPVGNTASPQLYAGAPRSKGAGELALDDETGAALAEKLTREQATLTETPDREISVVFSQEGEERRLTLLLCGDSAVYIEGDGDRCYRIDGDAEELLALLGLS